MKTVLFINGGKVTDNALTHRFQVRLEWAIDYYRANANSEHIIFLVAGRWDNATENYPRTEAEIAKEFILDAIPEATVIKEDVSLELIGNYAFSKPLLQALNPDKIIIITSDFVQKRVKAICQKIYAVDIPYQYEFMKDELSDNPVLADKESNALKLFEKLFADVADGDDRAARDTLLYKTPYYFKGIVDDKAYFDAYWPGGFEHFLHGVSVRNSR